MTVSNRQAAEFDTGDVPFLQIKASTWYKETFGLYDYEDPPDECQKLSVVNAFHLYRREAEDSCYISTKISKLDSQLLQVVNREGRYFIGTNPQK